MAKTNTRPQRVHKELDEIIRKALAKRMLRGERIKAPRLTLAIARQYKRYPNLIKELEEEDLR